MKLPKEQRQKRRGLISVPVSFEGQAETPAKNKKVCKGTTSDLSNSGLGIFSDVELNPDSVIEIECQDIWDSPKKFSVKWCNRVRHNFYRIGLEVTDES